MPFDVAKNEIDYGADCKENQRTRAVHFTNIKAPFCTKFNVLVETDEMRRPVSGRDAVRSQVIDALEAQEIKETGNEEG